MNYCSNCGSKDLAQMPNFTLCQNCKNEFYKNPKPTAGVILTFKSKILLVRRNHNPGKNLWTIPGGFVESKETLEQALVREMYEELCLNITTQDKLIYFSSYNRGYQYKDLNYDSLFSIFTYETKQAETESIKIDEENSAFEFFNFSEIQEMQNKYELYPEIFDIIKDYRLKSAV
jgi:ADP-ribose pyrophosphatase YjhB (NUDIX family)